MLAPIIRILLCLALCLVLFSSFGCPSQACIEYQDVAIVGLPRRGTDIDSVVMIANDSIIGCGNLIRKAVGSKTHHVKFPIIVHLQFFSQGDLRKELFFEMNKNTMARVSIGDTCSNRFADSFLVDDYCWSIGKIDKEDEARCTKLSVDGKQELCEIWWLL
jgi:hypothetical protein